MSDKVDYIDPHQDPKGKRRLLKALASAPVIVTLPSGASVANTSNCADKPESYDGQGRLLLSCWTSISPNGTPGEPFDIKRLSDG